MLAAIESIKNTSQAGKLLDRFARFQSGAAKLVIKTFDLVIKAYDREMSALGISRHVRCTRQLRLLRTESVQSA